MASRVFLLVLYLECILQLSLVVHSEELAECPDNPHPLQMQ